MAGGSGRRFGAPKQFIELAGRPVIAWSVDVARTVADGVVVVVPAEGGAPGSEWKLDADRVVTGGSTRASSVRAGLDAVPKDAAIVVVHDAARRSPPRRCSRAWLRRYATAPKALFRSCRSVTP